MIHDHSNTEVRQRVIRLLWLGLPGQSQENCSHLLQGSEARKKQIEMDTSITGVRVVRILDKLFSQKELPRIITVDNGPEFTSNALNEWAYRNNVKLSFSRSGTPTDNPFIESFNGRFRDECLDAHWFLDLKDARNKAEAWRIDYNIKRPHSSLEMMSPQSFLDNYYRKSALELAV